MLPAFNALNFTYNSLHKQTLVCFLGCVLPRGWCRLFPSPARRVAQVLRLGTTLLAVCALVPAPRLGRAKVKELCNEQ